MHTAEPLVPEHNTLEAEVTIVNLKNCKSPGSDQIPTELIQAGDDVLLYKIHKLINSIWNKEELLDQWKNYITLPIYRK
jgi:hypothetical protein